jgi:hypothetical protein
MAGGELSGEPYLQGKPCPKCGYARKASDTNPAWQCPKCQIAYAKFKHSTPLVSRMVSGTRELAAEGVSDRSVYALIAANLLAAIVAVAYGMNLNDLMLVYWVQSIMIGLSFFVRMLSLKRFSTEGMKTHAGPMTENTGTKVSVAIFFFFHYNFFHLGYLVFLVIDPPVKDAVPISMAGLAICALAFGINHAYSMSHNIRTDRLGKPKLSTVMMLPYARVIPMHAMILIGAGMGSTMRMLLFFIALKTAADVLMHVVEHHVLAGESQPKEA